MRRTISMSSRSLKAKGASRALLSIVSATSARLRAGRPAVPPKITSSIAPPRSRWAEALAHHPAQRFGEVRLAAAVRADDAGQTRADRHLGRVGEGFETDKAQPVDLHRPPRPALTISAQDPTAACRTLATVGSPVNLVPLTKKVGVALTSSCFDGDEAAVQDLVFERVVGEALVDLGLAHAAERREPGQRGLVVGRRRPTWPGRQRRCRQRRKSGRAGRSARSSTRAPPRRRAGNRAAPASPCRCRSISSSVPATRRRRNGHSADRSSTRIR